MVHSHFETFSQTAVLAAVAVSFHDNASSALLARVLQTLVERATKETLRDSGNEIEHVNYNDRPGTQVGMR